MFIKKTIWTAFLFVMNLVNLNCTTSTDLHFRSDGIFVIRSTKHRGFLNVKNDYSINIKFFLRDSAKWRFEETSPKSGTFYIKNANYVDRFLSLLQVSESLSLAIKMQDDHARRTWKLIKNSSGFYVKNVYSEGCLNGNVESDGIDLLNCENFDIHSWSILLLVPSGEIRVSDVRLYADRSWINDWVLSQVGRTCTSHAVTGVLTYNHRIKDINPYYLHDIVRALNGEKQSRNQGLSIKDVMEFACYVGVCRSEGEESHLVNTAALTGPRYSFNKIYDLCSTNVNSLPFPQDFSIIVRGSRIEFSLIDKIKMCIRNGVPVIAGNLLLRARKTNSRKRTLYVNNSRFLKENLSEAEEEIWHAHIFFGYDDDKQCFFIKNSWGDANWDMEGVLKFPGGVAQLPYNYVYGNVGDAYIGIGTRVDPVPDASTLKELKSSSPNLYGYLLARGHQDVYLKFLRGKLIYRPIEDEEKGTIVLPIAALANPLEGEFDLGRCGDAGRYLSINTGYRKGKKVGNANKMEIWFVPRFLIKKELSTTASHFRNIMTEEKWPQISSIGIFYTQGCCDSLKHYDYLTMNGCDQLDGNTLYYKWKRNAKNKIFSHSIYQAIKFKFVLS